MVAIAYLTLGAPGDVPGEARGSDRADMIVCNGYEFVMKRERERTSTGEALTGQLRTGDIYLSKYTCLASPLLIKALSLNLTFDEAKLMISHEDEETEVDYLVVEMGVVKVTEFSQMNDVMDAGQTRMLERLGLTAESMKFIYTAPSRSPKSAEKSDFKHFLDPNSRE